MKNHLWLAKARVARAGQPRATDPWEPGAAARDDHALAPPASSHHHMK
jgi:hypothetical protein